jgi:hypothetical protein
LRSEDPDIGRKSTMQTFETERERATMTTPVCPRCRFHTASPRHAGYCSWDCYEADDEDDEEDDRAA